MKEEKSRKISGSLAIKKPGIVLKGERGWLSDNFSKKEYASGIFTKMLLQRKICGLVGGY